MPPKSRGLSIAYSVETHLHADFVSGSRELAAVGAAVVGARAANLAFPHRGLEGGETLDLGGLTLEAIATPGHTPEHLSYLLRDGGVPLGLFTGGALPARLGRPHRPHRPGPDGAPRPGAVSLAP